jgi:hypothetical protein
VHLGACGDDDTRVAHYAWHQFIERYVEWCGFSFTHLRPEIFMQNMLGYGGESFIQKGVIRHYIGDARLSWVDVEDVGAAAAACLAQPEEHEALARFQNDARQVSPMSKDSLFTPLRLAAIQIPNRTIMLGVLRRRLSERRGANFGQRK